MFLNLLKKEANVTYTENSAVTYASTYSDCLDLFATVGALRREPDSEIVSRFMRAYAENADIAMKLVFFARDVRGGLRLRSLLVQRSRLIMRMQVLVGFMPVRRINIIIL